MLRRLGSPEIGAHPPKSKRAFSLRHLGDDGGRIVLSHAYLLQCRHILVIDNSKLCHGVIAIASAQPLARAGPHLKSQMSNEIKGERSAPEPRSILTHPDAVRKFDRRLVFDPALATLRRLQCPLPSPVTYSLAMHFMLANSCVHIMISGLFRMRRLPGMNGIKSASR